MAPMRSHIFDQLGRIKTKAQDSFCSGARFLCVKPLCEEFRQSWRKRTRTSNATWHCRPRCLKTTGLAPRASPHVLLEKYLKDAPCALRIVEFYMCGPADDERVGDQDVAGHGLFESETSMLDDFWRLECFSAPFAVIAVAWAAALRGCFHSMEPVSEVTVHHGQYLFNQMGHRRGVLPSTETVHAEIGNVY